MRSVADGLQNGGVPWPHCWTRWAEIGSGASEGWWVQSTRSYQPFMGAQQWFDASIRVIRWWKSADPYLLQWVKRWHPQCFWEQCCDDGHCVSDCYSSSPRQTIHRRRQIGLSLDARTIWLSLRLLECSLQHRSQDWNHQVNYSTRGGRLQPCNLPIRSALGHVLCIAIFLRESWRR